MRDMNSDESKPDWWLQNEQLREEMELPEYEPPRFSDGIYIYKIINDLEQKHDIDIMLIGRDTRYGDDWDITVDDETVGSISRHRDKKSNTVYEQQSTEFRRIIEQNL